MDYKEKYEQLAQFIKDLYPHISDYCKEKVEGMIPEFKESEDERIRKDIIEFIKRNHWPFAPVPSDPTLDKWVAWLEKQGEQKHLELKAGYWYFCHQAYCERADILTVKEGEVFKCEKDGIVKGLIIKEPEKYFREVNTPNDKVESKFKIGDWIIYKGNVWKICNIGLKTYYELLKINNEVSTRHIEDVDKTAKLWTIQDAKDGDVLADDNSIIIFRKIGNHVWNDVIDFHVGYNMELDKIAIQSGKSHYGVINTVTFKPATKEQRNLLFQKMHEAGYEWNAEKKELKKIKQNPAWSKEDEKFLNLSIENLTELKNMYGEKYGKVGDCIHWLKSLKERMKGELQKTQYAQKSADKIEPKFKVGDIISDGFSQLTIEGVQEDYYIVTNEEIENDGHIVNWTISFKDQDKWKIIKN